MKINANTKIIGEKVILVPYETKHVIKYHNWMKNKDLQELTASEPLTLNEEYEMQKSWRNDEDKCTFLILSRSLYEATDDEVQSLIGDTNLFIQINDDDENKSSQPEKVAEAEIMIAEELHRGQHLGWEAILLMLKYGKEMLNINKFIVKINMTNEKSVKLFEKIGFQEISKSNVFNEITFERKVDSAWINWLDQQVKLNIVSYVQHLK